LGGRRPRKKKTEKSRRRILLSMSFKRSRKLRWHALFVSLIFLYVSQEWGVFFISARQNRKERAHLERIQVGGYEGRRRPYIPVFIDVNIKNQYNYDHKRAVIRCTGNSLKRPFPENALFRIKKPLYESLIQKRHFSENAFFSRWKTNIF
jgi:hypothetical protein